VWKAVTVPSGDEVVIQANATFTGNFTLPAQAAAGS
jgi:hypothetical protein